MAQARRVCSAAPIQKGTMPLQPASTASRSAGSPDTQRTLGQFYTNQFSTSRFTDLPRLLTRPFGAMRRSRAANYSLLKLSRWSAWRLLGVAVIAFLIVGVSLPNAVSGEEGVSVILVPESQLIETGVGKTASVAIVFKNVNNLYGAELHLSFDKNLVQVKDADSEIEGIQIAPSGDLFPFQFGQYYIDFQTGERYYYSYSSDSGGYLVAQNEADNVSGNVNYTITLLNPHSPATTGTESKVLADITFNGIGVGEAQVYVRAVKLADANGNPIPVGSINGAVIRLSSPNNQPGQPQNISPQEGAADTSLTPTLQSSVFSDADVGDVHSASYWQVSAIPGDYSNAVFDSGTNSSDLTQIIVPSGILSYSTTYYWRLKHQDNHGAWSEWSAETSFTTMQAIPGDANSDGLVDSLDITAVERIIGRLDPATSGADANQDGKVNALDITKVERIVVGLD